MPGDSRDSCVMHSRSPGYRLGLAAGLWVLAAVLPIQADNRFDLSGDPIPVGARARMGTQRFLHGGNVSSLFVSPDGQLIASVGARAVCLWESATGKELHRFSGDVGALSPDGKDEKRCTDESQVPSVVMTATLYGLMCRVRCRASW
jgi:hypothetical protein